MDIEAVVHRMRVEASPIVVVVVVKVLRMLLPSVAHHHTHQSIRVSIVVVQVGSQQILLVQLEHRLPRLLRLVVRRVLLLLLFAALFVEIRFRVRFVHRAENVQLRLVCALVMPETRPIVATVNVMVLTTGAIGTTLAATTSKPGGATESSDGTIIRVERSKPKWQEVPILQLQRQPGASMRLQKVDDHHQGERADDGHQHRQHEGGAHQRDAEDEEGKDEEHGQQVHDGEPAIAGGDVAEHLGQWNGQTHARDGIEEQYAREVEEEMTQGQLQRVLDATRVRC